MIDQIETPGPLNAENDQEYVEFRFLRLWNNESHIYVSR